MHLIKHYAQQEHVLLAHQNQHCDSNAIWEQFVELIYMYDLILLRGSFNTCWVIFATDFLFEEIKIFPTGSIYLIPWVF